jgi:hypothetical protein
MTTKTESPIPLHADLLWGAQAIADELGLDRRAVFYLLQTGKLPATKTGNIWTSTRSRLRRHFEGDTKPERAA